MGYYYSLEIIRSCTPTYGLTNIYEMYKNALYNMHCDINTYISWLPRELVNEIYGIILHQPFVLCKNDIIKCMPSYTNYPVGNGDYYRVIDEQLHTSSLDMYMIDNNRDIYHIYGFYADVMARLVKVNFKVNLCIYRDYRSTFMKYIGSWFKPIYNKIYKK